MKGALIVGGVFAMLAANGLLADDAAKADEPQHVELDTTTIRSSSELPSVMAVVPWKKALPADLGGRPDKSLVESLLKPLDPDVFRLQLDFYVQLFVANESEPNGEESSERETDDGVL